LSLTTVRAACGTGFRRSGAMAIAAVGALLLAGLAARADARGGASVDSIALDLGVGLAFVLMACLATGAVDERLLVAAVGAAWFVGSVVPAALSLHQVVLAVALLAFPAGRLRDLPRRLLAVCMIPVAGQFVSQPGTAALFVAVAIVLLVTAATSGPATMFPVAAAAAVAAALLFYWWAARRVTSTSPLVVYEAALVAVAAAFPLATRAVARTDRRLADRVLAQGHLDPGLPGLQRVLASVLSDPDLRLDAWDPEGSAFAPADVGGGVDVTEMEVYDQGAPLARVTSRSPAIRDRPSVMALSAAVRLVAANQRLREAQAGQVSDLEASRMRLLAATDRERERVAARLREGVGVSLSTATEGLSRFTWAGYDDGLRETVAFALTEVEAAAAEVDRIVSGAPPAVLGEGELRAAVATLADRSIMPVSLSLAADASGDAAAETALFYVCAEALTNAAKHSGAASVAIELREHEGELALTIRDDGRGGADPAGSGLQGLADRLAAAGGSFTVDSPPGRGTTVRALVPRRDP
jgi:signal transduction histidine kinase